MLTHDRPWALGNHEDGFAHCILYVWPRVIFACRYLIGLENIIDMFSEIET